jgi:hypothetical protein
MELSEWLKDAGNHINELATLVGPGVGSSAAIDLRANQASCGILRAVCKSEKE